MNNARSAIVRPLVTEKSMTKVADGRYSFAVGRYATKTAVKNAIEKTFNVKVVSIATSVVKGKTRTVGNAKRRNEKPERVWKKATVTVKKGDRIYLFESGGAPEEEVKKVKKEDKKVEKKTEKKETKK
jgi:large subunit ribosomal protein L23